MGGADLTRSPHLHRGSAGRVGKAWLTDSEAVLCHPAQDELEPSVVFYKTYLQKCS